MKEKSALYVSVMFASLFAVMGVVFGIAIQSSMVMFDGIYSSISVVLSILSVVVLGIVVSSEEDEAFPFGKWHFEPALVVFKSLVIVGLCLYSMSQAISDLLSGGNEVDAGWAMLYAGVSTALCLAVFLYLKFQNRKLNSSLLKAETDQWLGDTLLSLGVMIGFGVSLAMRGTPWEGLIPYTDPFMVIVASLLFISFPMGSLLQGFRQLLFFRTDRQLSGKVKDQIAQIAEEMKASYKIHLVKIGRETFLEVNFKVADRSFSVREMDQLRSQIAAGIEGDLWLNMSITSEQKWM
ncbi:cation diffusion facilitator family transporter [Pontibacter sp. G13]|uniref:cation diffusion facilitator family transporter n=1 Tax=Pontibacter sp. G13 TaxID=3074898 RepID=UPI00288BED53|nr:cation diffusion facilitator family transporter [Pontibacter sp. G13]WNJ18803.1 cation diffusion facilitator family transporter [Pontibacter sp. G13]